MIADRIAPLKSERIQRPLPPGWSLRAGGGVRDWHLPDPRLAALWAGFLSTLAAELGSRPRIEIEGRRVVLSLTGKSPDARAADRRLLEELAAL